MTRREFLKNIFQIFGFVAVNKIIKPFNLLSNIKKEFNSELVSIKGENYYENILNGIEILGGISRFIKTGDKVVIKPNIAWNRTPEMVANTNPEIVFAIVDLCKKAGAKEVLVFDRTCNDPYLSYKSSGIKAKAEEAGAKVYYVNDVSNKLYQTVKIPKGKYLKESLVCKYILEADKIINIPVAKVHSSAVLTLALKNWMGTTGDNRGIWHFDLHQAIADYSTIIKPTLTIIDATRVMIKNGPTGGKLEYVRKEDLIIISTDQLLADVYSAFKIFNKKINEVPYLELAYSVGVGEINLNKAKIIER